jgi:D-threo-aldose 1-dehydrogenase
MVRTVSGTIAFVPYLVQNVLPWCSHIALSATCKVTCVREAHTLRATDKVTIGMTSLRVSRLGLGGVALSGAPPATDPHQTTSEAEAVALIQGSLALGLNYLDTAPMYGMGESERRYGQALHDRTRDNYVLSTKVGRVLHPSEPGSAQMTWSFDFSREGVRRAFETSLQRLGLDSVDILYIHDPDNHYEQALTEALPVLAELRAQGRVKAIGAGMNQWEMELQFAKTGQCDCFLLAGRYTLLDQTALPEFLPYCVEQHISVVAGGPYNSGILAVGPRAGATFNYRAASAEMLEKAQRINAVCERYQVPLKAAALQFILAHPAIASVIPGARSVAEVEDNVRMIEFPIPTALWAELKQAGLIAEAAPTPS